MIAAVLQKFRRNPILCSVVGGLGHELARNTMIKTFRYGLSLLGAAGLALSIAGPAFAFAGDRPLKNPLIVRISQTGFAGTTGTEYRLLPNGDYEVRTFVNDALGEPVKTGSLQPETFFPISQEVAGIDMETLAPRTEAYEGVNPSMVEITYGSSTSAAIMPPGYNIGEACPAVADETLCRVLKLAGSVQSSMEPQ